MTELKPRNVTPLSESDEDGYPLPGHVWDGPRIRLSNQIEGKPMTEQNEIWKQIAEYPNYEVSMLGNVRRIGSTRNRKVKVTNKCSSVRCTVELYNHDQQKIRAVRVKLAVMHTFRPEVKTDHSTIIEHIDGNRTNCALDNLRPLPREGEAGERAARKACDEGKKPGLKFDPDKVRIARRMMAHGLEDSQIASTFGAARATVHDIRRRKSWRWVE